MKRGQWSSLLEFEVKQYPKNPDNILLVGTDGNAKIADFRLSMTFEQAVKEKWEWMIRETKRYMLPELVHNNYDCGPHVDIWAIGCIVYELIMGKPLWDGDDDHVLQKIKFEKPKFHNSCWTTDLLLNHHFLQNSSK
ncbi:hypothetical protein KY284_030383 [Solanum tuberosum]|nr:hypothetical protein KY284_030383 [Solanum tuberosum]